MTTQKFNIGDMVNVLHAVHLPKEIISSTGIIERITYQSSDGTPLYWVSSRRTAVTDRHLRVASPLAQRVQAALDAVNTRTAAIEAYQQAHPTATLAEAKAATR
jgi:hypothetical protein